MHQLSKGWNKVSPSVPANRLPRGYPFTTNSCIILNILLLKSLKTWGEKNHFQKHERESFCPK